MERSGFLGTLIARWVATLTSLVVALAGALGGYLVIGTSHTASATHLLIPPIQRVQQASSASYAAPNPLLYLGSLTQARDALIRAVATKDVADELSQRYDSASLNIEPDATSSGPLIVIEVSAKEPGQAAEAASYAGTLMEGKLAEMQNSLEVSPEARITSLELTRAPEAQSSNRAALRGAAFVGVALLALGLIAVALQESRAALRRQVVQP